MPDQKRGDVTSDFVCSVCGAYFMTDEDRRDHLEKEAHGQEHEGTTREEMRQAAEQERREEEKHHSI